MSEMVGYFSLSPFSRGWSNALLCCRRWNWAIGNGIGQAIFDRH